MSQRRPVNAKEVLAENGGIGTAAATYVLRALRAAAGGGDRVVLCWDGDECTLRGLAEVDCVYDADLRDVATGGCVDNTTPLFLLTDVAVTSPEEDR